MQVHSIVEAADLDALQSIGEGGRGSAKARHACSSFVETARASARETARVKLNVAIDRAQRDAERPQRAPPVECGNPGCKTVQTDKKFKSCAQCRSVRYCCSACNTGRYTRRSAQHLLRRSTQQQRTRRGLRGALPTCACRTNTRRITANTRRSRSSHRSKALSRWATLGSLTILDLANVAVYFASPTNNPSVFYQR